MNSTEFFATIFSLLAIVGGLTYFMMSPSQSFKQINWELINEHERSQEE